MDGVGDGLLYGAVGASGAATGGRRLLADDLLARLADADADGRRTCSVRVKWSSALYILHCDEEGGQWDPVRDWWRRR
jgi:hypothetical protein